MHALSLLVRVSKPFCSQPFPPSRWVLVTKGAFHLGKKKTEISVGAKVEFPIGKKLFHLVLKQLMPISSWLKILWIKLV